MKIIETTIEGLIEIYPAIFSDHRGWFMESYNKEKLESLNLTSKFVQDNLSFSNAGVLRGLHFQKKPFEQGKLVKVIYGEVLDVAVDLRPESPTFGKYHSVVLTGKEQNMLYLPEGFAHGFFAIRDSYLFYKCTRNYNKDADSGIAYNDPDLGIEWGTSEPTLSVKDQNLQSFSAYKTALGL